MIDFFAWFPCFYRSCLIFKAFSINFFLLVFKFFQFLKILWNCKKVDKNIYIWFVISFHSIFIVKASFFIGIFLADFVYFVPNKLVVNQDSYFLHDHVFNRRCSFSTFFISSDWENRGPWRAYGRVTKCEYTYNFFYKICNFFCNFHRIFKN